MSDRKRIPLQRPWLGEEEIIAAAEALRNNHLVGDGLICKRVEAQMRELFCVKHVLLTTSCTHALEMAMIALDVAPDDEVILPSFAFSSCANAIVLRGARPIFAEIDPVTLNLDPDDVRRRITLRTKAVIPVHYAGVGCNMDVFMELAEQYGLFIVEDAAQAVDAKYRGRYLGTIGHIGCYSFHYTKNITCGEGGAFLTNSDEIARKAEIIREKGTNRSAFLRGEVDKYTWVAAGSSYVMSDLLAAVLEAQLAKRAETKRRRQAIWEAYYEALEPLANKNLLTLPAIPGYCDSNYHLFFFLVKSEQQRERVIQQLNSKGIAASFHFTPLHSAPYTGGARYLPDDELGITASASQTLIRLPIYPDLGRSDQDRIVQVLKKAVEDEG